jgi:multidrug efflux pump subunit AcrB
MAHGSKKGVTDRIVASYVEFIYVVDRIRLEVPRAGGDMLAGIRRAVSTTGMAVTFTATTMMAGVIPWYFLSSLRFSAEMEVLLAILLLTHWLSALTLTPALFAVINPKFARGEGVPVTEEGLPRVAAGAHVAD